MALSDYTTQLPRLVRETGNKLTSDDFTRALDSAVRQYSKDAPRQLVRDFAWSSAGHFSSTKPDAFTEASALLQAEYPIGNIPATTVELTYWSTEAGLGLMSETTLPAGAMVRLTFTTEHALVGGTSPQDTIPVRDRDAVLHFAAHLLCRELATMYSGERESSMAADGSNTESRARNYALRSKDYRAAYYAALSITDPMGKGGGSAGAASTTSGAGAVASWPARARPSWRTNDMAGGA